MISKEFIEKTKKCTSKEELLELAKSENIEIGDDEISVLLKSINTSRELSNEELENVAGGRTCVSSLTYKELGITPECPVGTQHPSNHPLIVALKDSCKLNSQGPGHACNACRYHHPTNNAVYCKARSREFDPTWK